MKHRIALVIPGMLCVYAAFFRPHAEAKPDAVTAASLTVGATNITATTATINYSRDKYDYGTRTLCYDPAPTTPKSNCVTKTATGNQGSFAVTGFKTGTAYNYSIKAVDTKGGEKPYTSTGTFTTTGTSGISSVPTVRPGLEIPGLAVDAAGRIRPAEQGAKVFRTPLPRR